MKPYLLIFGISLMLVASPPLVHAGADPLPASSKKQKYMPPEVSKKTVKKQEKQVEEDPELARLPEWERRYVKETRITIEGNVASLMGGLNSTDDLMASVDTFHRTWDDWAGSKLFILDDSRDIDVYGNLYSLQVLCRTLRLAAEDWCAGDETEQAQKTLKKARWLELRSRRLAEPVAEIIRHQSYSTYLPRRIEIMQDLLPYVDVCYKMRPFSDMLKRN